jgi:hypothetical protein
MHITYILYLEDSAHEALSSTLIDLGCERTDEIGVWRIPDAARPEIKSLTRPFGPDDFQFLYSLAVDDTDDENRLAAFLGIDLLRDPEDRPRCLLAKDPDDFSLIGNTELKDALRNMNGISWREHEEADLWRLTPTSSLPDAIDIPNPLNSSRGDDGLWHILGDGRSIISHRNLSHLQKCGVAFSKQRRTSEGTFDVRPFPVFSRHFIDTIQEAGATMPIAPIYLIPEDVRIEEW